MFRHLFNDMTTTPGSTFRHYILAVSVMDILDGHGGKTPPTPFTVSLYQCQSVVDSKNVVGLKACVDISPIDTMTILSANENVMVNCGLATPRLKCVTH